MSVYRHKSLRRGDMKAKIIYIAVLSGAITFNFFLITSFQLYTNTSDHPVCESHQFTDNVLPGEKAASLVTVIPCLVFLFSVSESPRLSLRVWPVSVGTRAPPFIRMSQTDTQV